VFPEFQTGRGRTVRQEDSGGVSERLETVKSRYPNRTNRFQIRRGRWSHQVRISLTC
jgi:hypothetical protein